MYYHTHMTKNKLIDTLKLQAENEFILASDLLYKGSYTYALFFGQMALEKLLKALIVSKKSDTYPPLHSLTKLAAIARVELTLKQKEELEEISSYNIKARYDDIKLSFYKKATKKYSQKWFGTITEYKQWIERLF